VDVNVPPISFTAPPATSAPVVAPAATPTAAVAPTTPPAATNVSSVLAPAKVSEYNRTNTNFRAPMPRPKVRGIVIDIHTHLLAARHADAWFEAARHYGIDAFCTMSPLEEAIVLQRNWPGRLQFIAIPKWGENNFDDWHRRLESFYNMGSRIIKFHMAPGTMAARGWRLDSPEIRKIMADAHSRGMILMSHIGDPDTWYNGKYAADVAKYGTRNDHYQMWESILAEYRDHPWLGAHLGGNPEDLIRLQRLLDTYPNLYLDSSATRWMVREISARRDAARDFIIRNQDRIIFGSDQVSGDDRGFDFLASRFWSHRKLWDTAYQGPCPILDPDLPAENQPVMRGLALPDDVLQKFYHDNAVQLLGRVGVSFPEET
jgi:predicted TIM-barrel fold metal-dependent hydrolase